MSGQMLMQIRRYVGSGRAAANVMRGAVGLHANVASMHAAARQVSYGCQDVCYVCVMLWVSVMYDVG